jgi:hypothetical protein
MAFRFLLVGFLSVGWVVGQDLRAPLRCTGPECAERVRVKERMPRRRVQRQAETQVDRYGRPKPRLRAERYRFSPPSPRHKALERAEAFTPYAPAVRHSLRAERQRLRASRRSGRVTLRAEKRHQQAACERPGIPHAQRHQSVACQPKPLRHRQNMQVASCRPAPLSHSQTHQKRACSPPPISHSQAYQRAGCKAPTIPHRLPENYTVPCDAQRRGVMTQTQRFAYDLRYLFTNHRKHCQVQSAYSGVSIGEWVNTEAYGRVPVVAYKMGWRVYHFAHFYDKKEHRLKKPRIEKRKVRALYQIQVLVPQPATGKSKKRRYIKGLPGIEGFGGMADMVLERKWLSPEETKAIQIEKLVRKRQIAWLVRAYPEEQVRLSEWLQKYAGPKPEHLWPGVDYRLLEVWQ